MYADAGQRGVPPIGLMHFDDLRRQMTVTCWYSSPKESPATWINYGSNDDAIAIRSSVERLIEALSTRRPIWIGAVRYIDYETEELPSLNSVAPIIYKQDFFAHEKEVRAVVWLDARTSKDNEEGFAYPEPVSDSGLSVPTKLSTLIESVLVSDRAEQWFIETVTQLLSRYGLSVPVRQSSLGRPPPWAKVLDDPDFPLFRNDDGTWQYRR
jgi:hypothetical protein